MNTRMYGRSPSAEMAKVVEDELGHQRKRKIREQNSYGLDQVRDGVSLGKDEVNDPIVDYDQVMRLPNLSFYVRLPGEYPVVRLKLKYRKVKKHHPGLMARNIRDVLSPELEKVIQENERAASAAGLTFPTGDEVLEGAGSGAAVATATATAGTAQQPGVVEVKKTILPEPVRAPESDRQTSPVITPPVVSKSAVKPSYSAEKNHADIPVPAPGTLPASTTVATVSPEPSVPAPDGQHVALPAALRALRHRHPEPEPPTTSGLSMLHRARQRPAVTGAGPQEDGGAGGESMNLDMQVTVLPDGALTVTTAGKPVSPDRPDEEHRTNRLLARDEENILRHRDADDPGYDENDHHYYDREPEL